MEGNSYKSELNCSKSSHGQDIGPIQHGDYHINICPWFSVQSKDSLLCGQSEESCRELPSPGHNTLLSSALLSRE